MTPTAIPHYPPIPVPDPDAIRAAIDVADERARLLRRLLRLALKLRLHLVTANHLPALVQAEGVAHAG